MTAVEKICQHNDLSSDYRTASLIWGVPVATIVLASIAQSSGMISLALAGGIWTASTAAMGVGCLINASRCGRVHCAIAGVLLPMLSVAGVANVLGLVYFSWDVLGVYWDVFWGILIVSFSTELLWRQYYRGADACPKV